MTEQEVRERMKVGLDNLKPKVKDMTSLFMDVYQQGFEDCFRILIGKDLL